jgi:hypothetical protein
MKLNDRQQADLGMLILAFSVLIIALVMSTL